MAAVAAVFLAAVLQTLIRWSEQTLHLIDLGRFLENVWPKTTRPRKQPSIAARRRAKKGQVARSRELSATAAMLAGVSCCCRRGARHAFCCGASSFRAVLDRAVRDELAIATPLFPWTAQLLFDGCGSRWLPPGAAARPGLARPGRIGLRTQAFWRLISPGSIPPKNSARSFSITTLVQAA